jgi:hypothetical protein
MLPEPGLLLSFDFSKTAFTTYSYKGFKGLGRYSFSSNSGETDLEAQYRLLTVERLHLLCRERSLSGWSTR